uniref:Uncharacterized protein n=1 Tax=uncultured prokaryote TaxID=198431 RepID=A0A0H5Q6Z3_9ZZZZ|nr:hypothetical protein [uncultured prokaryote]
MARPTEWRRTFQSFVDGEQRQAHATRGPAIFAGETVGRIHVHYQGSTFPAVTLAPYANEVMMGVWLQNNLSSDPDLDPVDDASSEEWMWWEGAGWANQVFGYRPSDDQEVEVDTFPTDGGYRDIKAQRKCIADGSVWIATAGDPAGGNQTNHYLQYAMSVLVILP